MITATVATWIVQRVAEEDTAQQAATAVQIDELRAQIVRLTDTIAAWSNTDRQPGSDQRVGK